MWRSYAQSLRGQVTAELLAKKLLAGWAHRRRDHGGVILLIYAIEGIVQVVVNPEQTSFSAAESVREFVIQVIGKVKRRPEGTITKFTHWRN